MTVAPIYRYYIEVACGVNEASAVASIENRIENQYFSEYRIEV